MRGIAADQVWPDKRATRRQFERAAAGFAAASFLHDEARQRLLQRLDYLRLEPVTVVDLGCGLGAGARALGRRFASARVLGVDLARAMLAESCRHPGGSSWLVADAEQLPFQDRSIGLVFANLLLPWCRPDAVIAEMARVLESGGLFLFSTLGPDSLLELRRAWATVDSGIHVHGFLDMHDLGDLLVRGGLEEPVIDVDRIEVTYPDARALIGDLRRCGGANVARGRPRGLTGPVRWRAVEDALGAGTERLSCTIELVFGQAWAPGAGQRRAAGPGADVSIPVDSISRRR